MDDAGGDEVLAVRLYEWNAEVSGAFMEVLHHMEVILRNNLDKALTAAYPDAPDPWYLNPVVLSPQGIAKAEEAMERIAAEGKTPNHGRVIAALGYGFWDALLSRRYAGLWLDVLRDSFPYGPRRRARAAEISSRIRLFRNRLAHHERIVHINLQGRHADMLAVCWWIDPRARGWVAQRSRIPDLLAARPE